MYDATYMLNEGESSQVDDTRQQALLCRSEMDRLDAMIDRDSRAACAANEGLLAPSCAL
jgi:hypothetical protein